MDGDIPGAILFDLDGVLVDSEHQEAAAVRAVLDNLGVRLERWEFVRAVHGVPREELAGSLSTLDACHSHRSALQHAFAHDMPPILDVKSMAGAPAALQTVLDHGLACAVATNAPHPIAVERLRRAGLDHFGLPVFSARDLPNLKPAADVFLHARHRLCATDMPTVVIEDSLIGARAAAAAGLPAVLVGEIGPLPPGCEVADGVLDAVHTAIAGALTARSSR